MQYQTITSAATSLNQIPAMFKRIPWQAHTRNLDMGGGRYNTASDYLFHAHKVVNYVLDPFNRSEYHNTWVRESVMDGVETVTLANVLNVINSELTRMHVLTEARKYLKCSGSIYISCYEGDRSGVGCETSKGWQENRTLRSYLEEVQRIFPTARITNGYITATKWLQEA